MATHNFTNNTFEETRSKMKGPLLTTCLLCGNNQDTDASCVWGRREDRGRVWVVCARHAILLVAHAAGKRARKPLTEGSSE